MKNELTLPKSLGAGWCTAIILLHLFSLPAGAEVAYFACHYNTTWETNPAKFGRDTEVFTISQPCIFTDSFARMSQIYQWSCLSPENRETEIIRVDAPSSVLANIRTDSGIEEISSSNVLSYIRNKIGYQGSVSGFIK